MGGKFRRNEIGSCDGRVVNSNGEFLETMRSRYVSRIPDLELVPADLLSRELDPATGQHRPSVVTSVNRKIE